MGKLSNDQIEELFSRHLPYKFGILLAHTKQCSPGLWTGDPTVLNACFVASLVTGRLFLNFLGIKRNVKDDSLQPYKAWDDDVSSADMGGTFVDIGSLPPRDVKLFADFLKMADKAAAHFSSPGERPWADTHEAIDRIVHYLRVHLYAPSGQTI